jgi:hypothetical protein
MKIGMWNVRSLLWSGALRVLHNELSNLDFNVVALQKLGWKLAFKNLITLLYSIVD